MIFAFFIKDSILYGWARLLQALFLDEASSAFDV